MKYLAPVAELVSVEAVEVLLTSTAIDCPRDNTLPPICDYD